MKKNFLFLALVISPTIFAARTCPEMHGKYYCVFSDGEGARLTINQWEDPVTDRVMNYTFSYREDNSYSGPIKYSDIGIMDAFGWLNKCERESLVSYSTDRSHISKIYKGDGVLIREQNGRVAMRCGTL